jgi:ATP-binding cassette subfamily F protein 3
MDVDLETNYDETVSDPSFFDKYQQKKVELDSKLDEWEAVHREIERNNM